MTTIVCDKSVMACDSRCVVGDTHFPSQKVWVLPGMIVGVAGSGRAMSRTLQWMIDGMPKTKPEIEKGNCMLLVLNRDGIFVVDETCFMEPVKRGFHAVGTGSGPALAAMMCGKSPSEAAEIACQIDPSSGGPVRIYKLSDAPPRPRNKRKV